MKVIALEPAKVVATELEDYSAEDEAFAPLTFVNSSLFIDGTADPTEYYLGAVKLPGNNA